MLHCYFLFTSLQSSTGVNANRMIIHVPWEPYYFEYMAAPIAKSIVQVGIKGTFLTMPKDFGGDVRR